MDFRYALTGRWLHLFSGGNDTAHRFVQSGVGNAPGVFAPHSRSFSPRDGSRFITQFHTALCGALCLNSGGCFD
jgi:hypothetical protein